MCSGRPRDAPARRRNDEQSEEWHRREKCALEGWRNAIQAQEGPVWFVRLLVVVNEIFDGAVL